MFIDLHKTRPAFDGNVRFWGVVSEVFLCKHEKLQLPVTQTRVYSLVLGFCFDSSTQAGWHRPGFLAGGATQASGLSWHMAASVHSVGLVRYNPELLVGVELGYWSRLLSCLEAASDLWRSPVAYTRKLSVQNIDTNTTHWSDITECDRKLHTTLHYTTYTQYRLDEFSKWQ